MKFKPNSTICFLSRRNSGKSHLCRHILFSMIDEFEEMFIVSQTENVSHSLDFLPSTHIMETWDSKKIQALMTKQETEIKKSKPRQICLILDDVIGSLRPNDPLLNKIFILGRHLKITICLLLQYSKACLSPTIRGNIDYLFFNRLPVEGLRVLYEGVHVSGDFKAFQKYILRKQKERPYTFLMYDSLCVKDRERWKAVTAPEDRVDFRIEYK